MRALSPPMLLLASMCAFVGAQPEPLLELRFDGSSENTGALGGAAVMQEYVPGEGPVYDMGVSGTGVSFANSSRSGGRDNTQAGGAIVFTDESLGKLRRFTVSLWFRVLLPGSPARLVYTTNWDLFLGGVRPCLKFATEDSERFLQLPGEAPSAQEREWAFLAAACDFDAGIATMYLGTPGSPPVQVARWEGLEDFRSGSGVIEVGNLAGIRPLKGVVDSVRIHGKALSHEEVLAVFSQDEAQERGLWDYAVKPSGRGVQFGHNDVCFSTRWGRPEAPDAIQQFKANRVVWVYTTDKEFVARVHDLGATVQGAINSVPRTKDLSAYAVDLDGTKLVAPWMVTFDPKDPVKWGCNNQPAFREVVLENAKKALDAGVDWLQFDDGALIVSAHSWGGGCMCDRCMEGFARYLSNLPREALAKMGVDAIEGFDYRVFLDQKHGIADAEAYRQKRREVPLTRHFEAFQRESVREFFVWLRGELDAHAGRRVPLSINANLQDPSQTRVFLGDLVDFFLGETWSLELADLAVCARAAEGMDTYQIISPFPHSVNDTRLAMAATYALGQLFLVPWDVWMGPEKDRYFGTAEQYGDLYHFVRDNPALFDDFETPSMVGLVLNTDRYDKGRTQSVARRLLQAHVPFSMVPSGHGCYDQSLDPERLIKFRMLVHCGPLDELAPEDQAAVNAVRGQVPILSDAQVTDRLLARLSPVQVWAPGEVYVLPRVTPSGPDRSIACHVLNRNQADEGGKVTPLRYISFGIDDSAIPGMRIAQAYWHAPGREPQELLIDRLPHTTRVIIPQLDEWGIALLKLEP